MPACNISLVGLAESMICWKVWLKKGVREDLKVLKYSFVSPCELGDFLVFMLSIILSISVEIMGALRASDVTGGERVIIT